MKNCNIIQFITIPRFSIYSILLTIEKAKTLIAMVSKAVIGCLLLVGLVFVHKSSGVPAKCSPALERIKRALAINSRSKRTIYVPPKTHWQVSC